MSIRGILSTLFNQHKESKMWCRTLVRSERKICDSLNKNPRGARRGLGRGGGVGGGPPGRRRPMGVWGL